MNENIWFGKPRILECSSCNKERPFVLDKYKIKSENSYIPGCITFRVDLNYRCCACGAIHPLFNSRNANAFPDAERDFKDIIERNRCIPFKEEVDAELYYNASNEVRVIVAIKTLGKNGGTAEEIVDRCIKLADGKFNEDDIKSIKSYVEMLEDEGFRRGLYYRTAKYTDGVERVTYTLDKGRFHTSMMRIYYDVCKVDVGDE